MRRRNHTIQILICSLIIAAAPLPGAVTMLVRDGHPIVDGVYVNCHGPYRFLVDTGSNVNLIDQKLAQSIGLTAAFQTELATSAGATVASGNKEVEVSLDSAKAADQEFLFRDSRPSAAVGRTSRASWASGSCRDSTTRSTCEASSSLSESRIGVGHTHRSG